MWIFPVVVQRAFEPLRRVSDTHTVYNYKLALSFQEKESQRACEPIKRICEARDSLRLCSRVGALKENDADNTLEAYYTSVWPIAYNSALA
jgi:hypothetical protein